MKMENKKRYLPNYTTTYEINNYINQRKTPDKGTREGKKKGPKSKQKTTPQSAKCTMGNLFHMLFYIMWTFKVLSF
jgi:hypothetical protein